MNHNVVCSQCAGPCTLADSGVCPRCSEALCQEFITCYRLVEGQHYDLDEQGRVANWLTDEAFHGYAIWLAVQGA
jgi:hypothetical protein